MKKIVIIIGMEAIHELKPWVMKIDLFIAATEYFTWQQQRPTLSF